MTFNPHIENLSQRNLMINFRKSLQKYYRKTLGSRYYKHKDKTTKELSQRWKLNPNTIEHWRTNGFGPHFIKIGRKILYSLDSIIAFERENIAKNTNIVRK